MKTFNNTAGTTSSEFTIGAGTTVCRQIVLGAVCSGADANATDRNGDNIAIAGTEFYDLKFLATDQTGQRVAKQFRGTITAGGAITKIEDIFEEGFNGDVELSVLSSELVLDCKIGTASTATYNIYVLLQRIE
jgi:hypothetical protein